MASERCCDTHSLAVWYISPPLSHGNWDCAMATIYVTDRDGTEHQIDGTVGQSIMEALRELDYGVEALCGGMCSCATCHVFIESEWYTGLTPPYDDELELLEETESYQVSHSRLSCQVEFTAALAGIRLTIAPEE